MRFTSLGSMLCMLTIGSIHTMSQLPQKSDANTELLLAAKQGDPLRMITAFSNGACVHTRDIFGFQPLHLATLHKHHDIVRPLLNFHNANVNAQTEETMDTNTYNQRTALHLAIEAQDHDLVTILIDHGADVNVRDNTRGCTPLHYAANNNTPDIIDTLIQNGAKVNQKDYSNFTPLHRCLSRSQPHFPPSTRVIQMLIAHEAEINTKNSGGKVLLSNPLYVKENTNLKSIIKLLIYNGIDPNIQDKQGKTLLHLCSYNPNKEHWTKTLCKYGANIYARMKSTGAPAGNPNSPTIQLIKSIKADQNISINSASDITIMLGQGLTQKAHYHTHDVLCDNNEASSLEKFAAIMLHAIQLHQLNRVDTSQYIGNLQKTYETKKHAKALIMYAYTEIGFLHKNTILWLYRNYTDAVTNYKDKNGNTFLHGISKFPQYNDIIPYFTPFMMKYYTAYNYDNQSPAITAENNGNYPGAAILRPWFIQETALPSAGTKQKTHPTSNRKNEKERKTSESVLFSPKHL